MHLACRSGRAEPRNHRRASAHRVRLPPGDVGGSLWCSGRFAGDGGNARNACTQAMRMISWLITARCDNGHCMTPPVAATRRTPQHDPQHMDPTLGTVSIDYMRCMTRQGAESSNSKPTSWTT